VAGQRKTKVDHAAAASGAPVDPMTREQRIALAVMPRFGRRRGLGGLEGGADLGEFGCPAGVGQEARVADAAEAMGQDMQQEPADELAGIERHRFALVAGAVVLPAEADAPILAREQTAVGEGDPVRVAAEIVENLPGPAERSLGIDDPFDAPERFDMRVKRGRLAQPREIAEEGQVASLKGRRSRKRRR
jgi:hypothetical protein